MKSKVANGARQSVIYAALARACAKGLSLSELVTVAELADVRVANLMTGYMRKGHVWRRRESGQAPWRYFLQSAYPNPDGPLPVLQDIRPTNALERALKLAGLMPRSAEELADKRRLPAASQPVEVIVPPNVKITRGPGLNHDPRYQVDALAFKGGELAAEWRAKRAGSHV